LQKIFDWQEIEHQDADRVIANNPPSVMALWNCGLLKFFEVSGMRSQPGLLDYLIILWDVDERFFRVGTHILTLEINDIYFLTSLSTRGAPVNLVGKRSSRVSTESLLATHCRAGARLSGGKITIADVTSVPLREILYTISRAVGSASCHATSKAHMLYVVECT